jgi:hypothetical protein
MANATGTVFGQINLGRSRVSAIELVEYMRKECVSLVFLQEQYGLEGAMRGGSRPPFAVAEVGRCPLAGFLFNFNEVRPLLIEGLSNECRCCMSLNVDGREIILISVYFKYSDNVHDHVLVRVHSLLQKNGALQWD